MKTRLPNKPGFIPQREPSTQIQFGTKKQQVMSHDEFSSATPHQGLGLAVSRSEKNSIFPKQIVLFQEIAFFQK